MVNEDLGVVLVSLVWVPLALAGFFWLRSFMERVAWLTGKAFEEAFPDLWWGTWLPFIGSVLFGLFFLLTIVGRIESESNLVGIILLFFVPLIGFEIFRGLVEVGSGVGFRIGMVVPKAPKRPRPFIQIGWRRSTTLEILKWFALQYSGDRERIRRVGALRVGMNVVLVLGLVFLLL